MSDTLQRPAIHGSASSDGANIQIILETTKEKQEKIVATMRHFPTGDNSRQFPTAPTFYASSRFLIDFKEISYTQFFLLNILHNYTKSIKQLFTR